VDTQAQAADGSGFEGLPQRQCPMARHCGRGPPGASAPPAARARAAGTLASPRSLRLVGKRQRQPTSDGARGSPAEGPEALTGNRLAAIRVILIPKIPFPASPIA
jgi:hypothetical protein